MHQPEIDWQIATRSLKWMAVSRRPLVPNELTTAATLDPFALAPKLAPKLTVDIDLLIQLCGGLILWDKQLNVIRF